MQLHEHLIDSYGDPKPVSVEVANACIRLAADYLEYTKGDNFKLTSAWDLQNAIKHDIKEDKA